MSTRSNKKKIAVIHNLTSGGSVRVLEELNKKLFKRYEIHVYKPIKFKPGPSNRVVQYLKYIYVDLPYSYKKIADKINSSNYVAVILHHDTYTKSPLALLFLKPKTIYFLHEPPREFYEPIRYHAPLLQDKLFNVLRIPILIVDQLLARKATQVIVNSKYSKRKIDKIYGVNSKVVYLGVSKIFAHKKNVKRENVCISVGSLLPYKGHELTINALSLLEKKFEFIIIGSGRKSEKYIIRRQIKRTGIKVKIVSNISDKKLVEFYSRAKVYVNSAYQEPFGLSALEAVASGAKVVTVNDCGTEELKEFFPKRVMVVQRNANSIAIGVKRSVETYSKKNIKIPKEFDWNNAATEIHKIIKTINISNRQ